MKISWGSILSGLLASLRKITRPMAVSISIAAWMLLGGIVVFGSMTDSDSSKLTPRTLSLNSDPSLPKEVRDLEAASIYKLFDRDTDSEFTAFGDDTVDTTFETTQTIDSIRVYGAAPYTLTVRYGSPGAWQTVPGLANISLSKLKTDWNTFTATSAVSTAHLQFELKQKSGGTSSGLREIEVWGKGHPINVPAVDSLKNLIVTNTLPDNFRDWSGAAGRQTVESGHAKTMTVTIDRDPTTFKHAYLVYQVYGLGNWVSVQRSINSNPAQGGAFMFADRNWSTQVEAIHPHWLVAGNNRIQFSLPDSVHGAYTIENVRLVAELENGHNFVAHIDASPDSSANPAAALTDGKLDTGWRPWSTAGGTAQNNKPTLTINLDKPSVIDGLSLNLVDVLNGTISVAFEQGGKWTGAAKTINARKFVNGWNSVSVASSGAVDAIQLTFENGQGSAGDIRELMPIGSGVGPAFPSGFTVTYPDDGQFYGRTAYIRGFLDRLDNGSGKAKLFIGGLETATSDGAFGVLVDKDQVGLSKQADAATWSVTLDAIYPNGEHISSVVVLNNPGKAKDVHGALPAVNPQIYGSGKHLQVEGAELNADPDAIDGDINIKITPLSADELPPLDPGMTNVTKGPHAGYRFTPHPYKFKKNIEVILPYDKAKIPAGMNAYDVKTYFFDEAAGHWAVLERAKLDQKKEKVTSLTDHFTDMINATVVVPEHPQAVNFNPTQIKDIKAADPGAGINLIEAPNANNMGDARLSYPIEVPAGRAGMQPQLAIQYNSGGGNGWLGLGWDLSVPSVGIETRWGVPRYSDQYETETYTLNGQQLTPLAFRDATPRPRFVDDGKTFHTRVEGAFQKIQRHGDKPSNYWWEVTDKNGTRNFYGGDGTHQIANAVLGSDKGVFKWMLVKTVDANGNYVEYSYDRVCDTGTGTGGNSVSDSQCDSGVSGYQLYLSQVRYTGGANKIPSYTVDFVRDSARSGYLRDSGNSNYDPTKDRRPDVSIDARGGFKQVTAERLSRIDIKFNGQPVRSYTVTYQMGVFQKSLMSKLTQLGADGKEFNSHAFAYNNDIMKSNGQMELFKPSAPVSVAGDNVNSQLLFSPIAYPETMIGGNSGTNAGFTGYFGIGPPTVGKQVHVAATFGANVSSSNSKIAMVDIDGDGLVDKVFEDGNGQVVYRRNITPVGSNTVTFEGGNPYVIQGLGAISRSNSDSWSTGIKGKAGPANASTTITNTATTDEIYFADVNGDGLVDQVDGGVVRFNYLNAQGRPTFTTNSGKTLAPIETGNVDGPTLLAALAGERKRIEDQNPLMDAVRRWVAPYSGRISISGSARLHNFRTDSNLSEEERKVRARYTTADGVIVSIQHNANEIWSSDIGGEDYSSKAANVIGRQVNKGDVIYFRVRSKYDGSYDQVDWSPVIQYVDSNGIALTDTDANKLNPYFYGADNDLVMAGRPGQTVMPNYGTVKLEGVLQKTAATSDDVRLVVRLIGKGDLDETYDNTAVTIYSQQIGAAEIRDLTVDQTFDVKRGQGLSIEIETDSPIDLTKVKWGGSGHPQVYYTAAYEPEVVVKTPQRDPNQSADSTLPASADAATPDTSSMQETGRVIPRHELDVVDSEGRPIRTVPANYDADVYSITTEGNAPQAPWVASKDGVIIVSPWMTLKSYPDPNCDPDTWLSCQPIIKAPDGDVAFTVKRNGQLLAKQILQVRNKQVVATTQGYSAVKAIEVHAGDRLFFDFSSRNGQLAGELKETTTHFAYGSATTWKAPLNGNVQFSAGIRVNLPDVDEGTPPPRPVMLLVRKGANIIYQKLLSATEYPPVSQSFALDIASGENYSFDYFSIDPDIQVLSHSIWATYSAPESFTVTKSGPIAIDPVLNFSSPVSGGIELHVAVGNGDWNNYPLSIVDGVIQPLAQPLEFNVNNGDVVHFEYQTTNHVLSSAMTDRGQVAVRYSNKTSWTVPNAWKDSQGNVALDVNPQLTVNSGAEGAAVFRVYKSGAKIAEIPFTVANGTVSTNAALPVTLNVKGGDLLQFEYSTSSTALADSISQHDVVLSSGTNNETLAAEVNDGGFVVDAQALHILMPDAYTLHSPFTATLHYPVNDPLYGNPYRNWSFVAYNSNGARGTQPIDESRLRLKTKEEYKDPYSEDPSWISVPMAKNGRWESADDNWWIGRGQIRSSRRGLDQINVPEPSDFQNSSVVMRIPKRSQGTQFSNGGGVVVSVNFSNGTSSGSLDLMDINGDRYPDMIGNGNVQYTGMRGQMQETMPVLPGTNTTASEGTSFSYGPGSAQSTESATGKTQTQGNKKPIRVDISGGWGGGGGIGLGLNTGSSRGEITLSDINGDGLPDRVRQNGGQIYVQLNEGYGFAPEERWGQGTINYANTNGFSFSLGYGSLGYNTNDGQSQLMDVNGDGLADSVTRGSDGTASVMFNTGSGFSAPVVVSDLLSTTGSVPGVTQTHPDQPASHVTLYDGASLSATGSYGFIYTYTIVVYVPIMDLVFGGDFNIGATISQPTIGFRDLDGDGLVDSIRSVNDGNAEVGTNNTGRTNLLREVRRPLGSIIDIDYQRTGNTYNMPQSKWVMSKVKVFDGTSVDGEQSPKAKKTTDYQVTTFKYLDGKQDRLERDFLGFAKVEQTQLNTTGLYSSDKLANAPPYRRVTQTFRTDSVYTKGLQISSLTEGLQGGTAKPYNESINKYAFVDIQAGTAANLHSTTETVFPQLIHTENRFYEGGPSAQKSSGQSFVYDNLGNVTTFTDEGDLNNPDDDVRAIIAYSTCTDSYIVGKATSIQVYNKSNSLMRRREADVDCTTGNVTEVRQYTGGQAAITKLTYEDNGNIHSVEGPANANGQHYTLTYGYEKVVDTYPNSIQDSFGYESGASYDYRFGKPLSTTDLNGNAITYTYDSVGRTKTVVGPYETAAHPTIEFEYHPFVDVTESATPFISWAKTRHFDKDADNQPKDTIDTVLFTDGLKRVLQTKKDATLVEGKDPVDKMIVSGRVVFDGLGRIVEQYYPVAEDKGSDGKFNAGFDSVQPTVMTYDVMDRNLSTTIPDGTTTSMVYGFGADRQGATQFRAVVTDAEGHKKESFRDARQLVTAIKEFTNNQALWTSYQYDALKQIIQVEDHKHNLTKVTYDNFGRRTSIDNPDTGLTKMAYDLASNLTTKTTAKGDVISYHYDISHLTGITYPRYTDNNVTYVYGGADTRGNGKNQVGRIIKVTNAAGITTREYGKLGETTKDSFTVTAAQGGKTPTYVTEHTFDTFGRMLLLKLPNGEVIRHEYDSGGNVNRISGTYKGKAYNYLQNMYYDKFEQRVYMKLGNGVETNYTYNAKNRRLKTLASHSPNPTVGDFQNLNYGYDNVGNITSLKNDVQIPGGGTLGGPAEQHFTYDDLYRLVHAEGVFTGSQTQEDRYTLNMAYDGIHNITHKTQSHTIGKPGSKGRTVRATTYDWAYAYTGPHPHAPTNIGTRNYTYDANGNQTGYTSSANGTRRVIDWDEENRVAAIHDPGNTASYVYDDTGERKIKRGRYGETVYVNQFFTVRNGALASEHLYAGMTRIVTKLMPGGPIGTSNNGQSNGSGNITSTSGTATVLYNGTTISANGTTIKNGSGKTNNVSGTNSGSFPGQGLDHRSDRANEVARNTEKNKHLNGGVPGGTHGAGNSNAGGNGNYSGNNGNQGNGHGGSGNNGNGGSSAGGGNGANGNGGGGKGSLGKGTEFLFFYHPDHLGSSSFVTDANAKLYEHMEYFPFGESWVSESSVTWKTPYLFTSKELDVDTQLYYYGARYYDPRTSVWQSADPAISEYLGKNPKRLTAGGVFRSTNLGAFSYAGLNPIRLIDFNGRNQDDSAANNFKVTLAPGYNKKAYAKELAVIRKDVLAVHKEILQRTKANPDMYKEALAVMKKGVTYEYDPRMNTSSSGDTAAEKDQSRDNTIKLYNSWKAGAKYERSRDLWGETMLSVVSGESGDWSQITKFMRRRTLIHEFRHLMPSNERLVPRGSMLMASEFSPHEGDARRFTRFVDDKYFDMKNYSTKDFEAYLKK